MSFKRRIISVCVAAACTAFANAHEQDVATNNTDLTYEELRAYQLIDEHGRRKYSVTLESKFVLDGGIGREPPATHPEDELNRENWRA